MKIRSLITLSLLLASLLVSAQPADDRYAIHFRTGTVIPEANLSSFLKSYTPANETLFSGQFFQLIQFEEIPTDAVKQTLLQAGVTLLDYLPHRAYFAAFRPDFNREAITGAGIRSITGIREEYKRSPLLYEGNYPAYALMEGNRISILVSWFSTLDNDQVLAALQSMGYSVISTYPEGDFANILVSTQELSTIANLPFVIYLEPVNPEPKPENNTGRSLHRTNTLSADYATGRQYDGSDVQVMLQDDGIIGPHVDYQGRIGDQFLTSNSGNHGDHCAGIIMAAGNIDPLARGNAPGATIWVYSASNYPGFNAIPTVYNTLGIRVTSCSYGDGCNSGYNSLARMLDQQVRQYPSLLHVFSTGNSGTENCGYGAGSGWGNITGGHKVGKNVISVANVDYTDNLATSSSRGPAHDGRIKPDLAAKGSNVYSTIDPNDYALKSGTSMACPGTAGTLASLVQAYRELYGGSDPMAGLLKGLLLNTAEDLGNPGPDFKFGWGRINALRAIQALEEGRFDSVSLGQGQTESLSIEVPSGVAQLRVMIYWTDFEATINTSWALVNNLDMTLTDPSSTTWLPWKLSHYPHPDSLNMPAFRGIDNRNNMEQVTIDNPASGTYTLEIHGTAVPQGPQTCYLLYEWIFPDVVLTYPNGGEPMVPGETETLRWDAHGTGNPFTLEYSLNNGQTWDTIAGNIAGTQRLYSWTVPPGSTGTALVRISDGNSVSTCEAPFTILGLPCNLTVDRACQEAIYLSWGGVPGATAFEVMMLGDTYMEPVGTTPQTSFFYEAPGLSDETWITVRALGPDGAVGRRLYALHKTAGTTSCYTHDAMLEAIPSADWGVFPAILTGSPMPVTVVVRNFGTEPVVNPVVAFRLGTGTPHSETVTATIDPDSTVTFTFSETITLSQPGSYLLTAWVEYGPDQYPDNNQMELPLEVITSTCVSFGYTETFDAWTTCSSAPICELYSCELEQGWRNLANGVYDIHDWRTYYGPTTTSGTGPANDHTLGTYAGHYLYIEPSQVCFNKEARILTPCIDLTNGVSPTFSFWYHAHGADIGWLHLDLFDGQTVYRDIMVPVAGSQENTWLEKEVDLSSWNGEIVQLQFRGITSCNQKGDIAIDDVSVTDITGTEQQAGAQGRLQVYPNPASGEVTVSVTQTGNQPFTLQIIDLFGRDVIPASTINAEGGFSRKLNLGNLPAGIYIISVTGERESYREKVMVK